jgi:hypothetical protein
MHVCVHQAESQYHDSESFHSDIDTIHTGDEIIIALKHNIHCFPVSAEVPAILDDNLLPLDKRFVQSQIRDYSF